MSPLICTLVTESLSKYIPLHHPKNTMQQHPRTTMASMIRRHHHKFFPTVSYLVPPSQAQKKGWEWRLGWRGREGGGKEGEEGRGWREIN